MNPETFQQIKFARRAVSDMGDMIPDAVSLGDEFETFDEEKAERLAGEFVSAVKAANDESVEFSRGGDA